MRGWLSWTIGWGLMMGFALLPAAHVVAKPSLRTLRKQCRRKVLRNYNKCMTQADRSVVQCQRSCRQLPRDVGGCVLRCHRLLRRQKVLCRRSYRSRRRSCWRNPRGRKTVSVGQTGCAAQAVYNYRNCMIRNTRSRRACRRACAADCPIHHPCRVRCRKLYRAHDQLCFQAYRTLVSRCKKPTKRRRKRRRRRRSRRRTKNSKNKYAK